MYMFSGGTIFSAYLSDSRNRLPGIFYDYQNLLPCRYKIANRDMPEIFAITFDITGDFFPNAKKSSFQFE